MAVQVHNGEYRQRIVVDREKHAEREAMKHSAPNIAENERELPRSILDPAENRAKLVGKFKPETVPFTLVPRSSVEGIEFSLWANVESRHLRIAAQAMLKSVHDVPPRLDIARRPPMSGKPFLQHCFLPLMKRHAVNASGNVVPQRLHIVDLIFDRELVESRRQRQRMSHIPIYSRP
jgi:hypothetical protein